MVEISEKLARLLIAKEIGAVELDERIQELSDYLHAQRKALKERI